MRRAVVSAAVVALALLAAPAAVAHEEINPPTIQTGKPVFFTLSAANEEKSDMTKVVLTAPKGVKFGTTTREPTGWTVNRTDAVITWTGGTVKPDHFDQWGFEIDSADQPGTLTFKASLTTGGKSDDVDVPVTATAGGTTPSTAPGASSPVTAAPATSGTAAGLTSADRKAVDSAKSRGNAGLVLGIIGAVLGLAALLASLLRRPGRATAASPGERDW